MKRTVSGLMVKYFHTCHRELWFYANKIDVDRSNVGISHGSHIDDSSYSGSKKRIFIDGVIALDILEDGTVVEVKRSSRLEEPGIWQLKYYLWYLKAEKGVEVNGEMAYPRERKRKPIILTQDDEAYLESIIPEIQQIISFQTPPPAEWKSVCEGCAYFDLCWV